MSLKKSSSTSQFVMESEFTFNFDDTMVEATGGTTVDFGKTNFNATAFDIIQLPPGSVLLGGELVVETAMDAATYAVIIGDSGDTDRYLTTADRKGAARTALVPTGYHNTGGLALQIGVTCADTLTQGKATVRIQYVIAGRVNEQV